MGPEKLWPDPEPDTYTFERCLQQKGYQWVGGLDEVGRGPLAGPVVAACVILAENCNYSAFVDSKVIKAQNRSLLYKELLNNGARIGVGIVSEKDIDRLNILQASLLAMKKAVIALPLQPDFLLVDGNQPIPMTIPQQTLVKGESKSASIAAASIVAKVVRDELMDQYHVQYPEYNFQQNRGYPTLEHRLAIQTHGPCAIHRQSFKCVKEFIAKT
ncbi:MAG: ribonuclease HII [Deltaproteobacteria bacterium]|jgi:ribonuclease HII|nr:MAG: ribonuclease HII [Deltaproteobacteria bacterium]